MARAINPVNHLWQAWLERDPQQIALEHAEHALSWQMLDRQVGDYANALREQGVQPGAVVTLVGKNHLHSVLWFLACMQIGALCAFLAPQPLARLQQKLSTLYAEQSTNYLWLAPSCALSAEELKPLARYLLSLPDPQCGSVHGEPASRPFSAATLATLIFTSGSTGVAKAVAHTHQQHLASAQGLLADFAFSQADNWLLSLPLYHISGVAIIYRWLAVGARLKIGTGDLERDMLGVTHASLVPTQLKRLLDRGQPLDLQRVLLGGSHIPLALAEAAAQRGIDTWLGYGMTEAASTVTAKRVDGVMGNGQLLAGRELRIINGRIFIAGQTLAAGYYQQGDLRPLTDRQGWFDSQDLGHWQENNLVIDGRADNLFISGGENIHCEEIEAVLIQHPQVQVAIVLPVQDDEYGARPVAVVRTEQAWDQAQGDACCHGKLEKFKWPIGYFSLPDALLDGGIKVSRAAVKAWLAVEQPNLTVL
ncbi:MAG: o-succinylbenzoate--CoA ligase [Vibrio sp.]|uniref:O-succinylbenzoate--CoA ligase n=1 Tax=Vibrio chanodichtyis TaxID=3027932 RepID=A0ABT5V2X5_9VIBR|nr:o-succinylbenzoate--CoA ligase [Vibrio chanodichtyis]MDE1514665.1 o-succinylbenzoate--CoA ligase [Vibrio chanodichtyis]